MALIAPQDLAFLLLEGRSQPTHVGGLSLFEPPEGASPHYIYELYQQAIDAPGDVRSLFRKRPVRRGGLGPYEWELDDDFDIEYHVRHSALPEPGRVRELLTVVSRLHGSLLDRNRPLWESHLIEGLAQGDHAGEFAMYTKVHHALVDGVTAMRLLVESLSTDPAATDLPLPWERRAGVTDDVAASSRRPPPTSSTGNDTWTSLLTDGLRDAAGAVADAANGLTEVTNLLGPLATGLRDQLVDHPVRAPHSSLNVPITGARRFAAESWSLARVKDVGRRYGATVNDMVLAMSAGALRAHLQEVGELPDESLVAMVPVSLKTRGAGDETGNAVAAVLCSLGTHLEEPKERLDHIMASMRHSKARLEGLTPSQILALSALQLAPGALQLTPLNRVSGLGDRLRPPFNVVISNVPGSPEQLYWNGARLVASYPVSLVVDGQALNITTTSYAGSLDFGILGCRRSVPSLQRMLAALEAELAALE